MYQLCTKKAKITISELNLNLKVKYFEALLAHTLSKALSGPILYIPL